MNKSDAILPRYRFENSAATCRSGAIPNSVRVGMLATLPGASLLTSMMLMGILLLSLLPPTLDASESDGLTLIELYTSHGCSSCPPADQLLGELLDERDDLIALEFHVDYWNDLVHGRDGNFEDPFSSAEFSKRQRQYNTASLAGRPGVYTPQAIVNGRFATVGSNRKHITRALSKPAVQLLDIGIASSTEPGQLSVTISGASEQRRALAGVDILLARYIDKSVTDITGGENNRKTLTNHHIVTNLTRLGEVSESDEMSFTIIAPDAAAGCVVMVQEDAQTAVFAAAACP